MQLGNVFVLICFCATIFCFQTVFGVGIGLLTIPVECYMMLKKGTGNQMETRYYYEHQTGICRRFTYTGSGGNVNNFGTLEECMQMCKGKPEPQDDLTAQNLMMKITTTTKPPAKIDYLVKLRKWIQKWKTYVNLLSKL